MIRIQLDHEEKNLLRTNYTKNVNMNVIPKPLGVK